jgi:glutaredoxin-like protein
MEKEKEKEENGEKIIKKKDREQIQTHFEALANPVTLVFFTQETECQFCRETRKILTELSELSRKINLEVYDFEKDTQKVSWYTIDKIPATAVVGEKDYGIRFFGMPSGYEFTPLILDILAVSRSSSTLQPETQEKIKKIDKHVHIQVFTTPTCPFCAQAVQTAHQCAVESDFITAHMVESVEFPHLAHKYDVFSVPKIIINETHAFEGALPEDEFADEIIKAVSQ